MNITPVSMGSSAIHSSSNNDKEIRSLEKEKMHLQDQIQKINESKLDSRTKQSEIKQVQDQIQQIDDEIKQMQTERFRQNQDQDSDQKVNKSQSNVTADENGSGNNLAGVSDLIKAGSTYSNIKIMSNTKNSLHNLGNEVGNEGAGSITGVEDVSNEQRLAGIKSHEMALGRKVADADLKLQKQVKEASTKAVKNNNKINKNKISGATLNISTDNDQKSNDIKSAGNNEIKNPEQQAQNEKDKIYKRVDVRI